MKIALCFIISYEHILTKEEIWKEWIEPNKDIINVYFFYKDFDKIKSPWIREHTIPPNYICKTSYYHVVPAYISIMKFALHHDVANQWFCLLTDSCCPVISPTRFRELFNENYDKSILKWSPPWWNIDFHKRANLHKLPTHLQLANDPWFILKRENVKQIFHFIQKKVNMVNLICNGGLANESIFAIILSFYKQLNPTHTINAATHITDWSKMSSATSPYIFKTGNNDERSFIEAELNKNKYAIFVRKVAPEFIPPFAFSQLS